MHLNRDYRNRINESCGLFDPRLDTSTLHLVLCITFSQQLTDIEEQLETDSIPIKEEEEEDLPEVESEQGSEKDEKPTMPFGDFLDLMEVF